jgi:adenine-specific DNA-methyltransferase
MEEANMSQSEGKTGAAQPEQKTHGTSSQEKAASPLEKFQDLIRQLFQIEAADLDFGIYRILNYKRKEVEEFINKRLPQIVNKAFQDYAKAEGMAQYQVTEDLKNRVYNDLYTFFSRYYEDGDFIAKRRYGRRETYAIPYNGEEVVLHWATKDQYYIKTGERLKNYRFKVKISTKDKDSTKVQDYTIAFELRSAKTEQNNNKGEKRYFILASDNSVAPSPEAKTITVFFEYRPLTEAEQKEFGKTKQQQKLQDNLNEKAADAILKRLQDLGLDDLKPLEDSKKDPQDPKAQSGQTEAENGKSQSGEPEAENEKTQSGEPEAENEKTQSGEPETENRKSQSEKPEAANGKSLLMKHLTRFTRRNTSDFFIHKNLRGFLRRELDFFIKSECLLLDELLAQEGNLTHQDILRARAVRDVGHQIIEFLAQVEDFQKRLFEKKKFVIRTEYCITMDRVPEELWDEVLQNKDQLDDWRQLYGVDPQPTKEFLREHPYLVVDTCHFSEDFKWRLLGCFDDLDEALDGLLIKSENFQALNLLMEKYRGKVNCIYIDPPYNTGQDSFIYKDRYQHSSWLSMMQHRMIHGKQLLNSEGVFFISIDDHEQHRLKGLLCELFSKENFISNIVWRKKRVRGRGDAFVIPQTEYILIVLADGSSLSGFSIENSDLSRFNQQDDEGPYYLAPLEHSSPQGAYQRKNLQYKLILDGKEIYCQTGQWLWSLDRVLEEYEAGNLEIKQDEKGRWRAFRKIRPGGERPTSLIDDKDMTTNAASIQIKHLFGSNVYGYSKPHELIMYLLSFLKAKNMLVVDFFAGSGTTAHAVINLNREDGGRRKYILVEMGDYFETVLLKRIKKVVYSDSWKDGKPQKGKGISHFFKYLYLEQYEDTLNNLDLTTRKQEGQLALERFGDEYLLRYMLDFETQGSPSLLNLEKVKDPFAYKLKVQEGDEIRECVVDLVETFNYLLGIHVKKMRQFQDNGRLYRAVLGEKRGKRIVIVWRPLNGLNGDTKALQQDRQFIQCTVIPALLGEGKKPDRLLVNGNCYVPGVEESIETEFKRLMWRENQDGWEV